MIEVFVLAIVGLIVMRHVEDKRYERAAKRKLYKMCHPNAK